MNSAYEFRSRWHVGHSRESLWDSLEALLATDNPIPWWPSVQVTYYDGDDLELRAASHLGYALTFRLADLESYRPDRLTFTSSGDLRGTGEVTFVDLGARSAMDIDWHVATDRRWMRWSTWVLRPVFVAGHHLIMRQGEKHLNAWLDAHEPGQ
jgi:hypothetical protein